MIKLKTISALLAAFIVWTTPVLAQDAGTIAPGAVENVAIAEIGVEKNGVVHLTHGQAQAFLLSNPEARVLDVRTKGEYKRGHVSGALRAGFFSTKFSQRLQGLDRETPWIVHCKSGHRSERAVKKMRKLGFARIYHMDGGMDAWRKADLPVEKGSETPRG